MAKVKTSWFIVIVLWLAGIAAAQMGNLGSTLGSPVFSYFLTFGKDSIIYIVMLFSLLGAISGIFVMKKMK